MKNTSAPGMGGGTDAVQVVRDFLAAMERLDLDAVLAFATPDIVWVNAPITTSKGKRQLERALRTMMGDITVFRVEDLEIYQRPDGVVVTDRVDVLEGGGLSMRFAVLGEFVVRDGLVASWTDRFSWRDVGRQTLAAIPGVLRFRLGKLRQKSA